MPRTVLDAGPLIHLDQLGCIDLLEGFPDLLVPPVVWQEALRHRPSLLLHRLPGLMLLDPTAPASSSLAALIRTLSLDAGEIAALMLLEQVQGQLFLCDDAAARLAAETLGFSVHGTVGLIVRAVRRKTRTVDQVRTILQTIPARSTLHISSELLRRVISLLPTS